MSNVLKEAKRELVLLLGRRGAKLRHIEEVTGIRRETASRYLKEAGIAVRPPGGWGKLRAKPANEVITDPAAASKPANEVISGFSAEKVAEQVAKAANEAITDIEQRRAPPVVSACVPYREFIETEIAAGRNAKAIWQELVTEHGFGGAYPSVMRYTRKLRGATGPSVSGLILTAPGEEAQVDYGTGPLVRHPQTGKYRRTRLFALTLGWSRKSVWLLSFQSSAKQWAQFHEEAFSRLGGSTRIVVLDNLKEGVLKPDIYDPEINPLYKDVLAHYGVTAVPARVRDPDRKGKVERAVGYAQDTALKGKRFDSLEAAQAYLDAWAERWADTRIHGTTKRQVRAAFEEEKPSLQPLPPQRFAYYEFGVRTVHINERVEVAGAYYEVPPGIVGKELLVKFDSTCVRIIEPVTGKLLREHVRHGRGRYSPSFEKHIKTPPEVLSLLAQMQRIGPSLGEFSKRLHEAEGDLAVRRILGLRSMCKEHTPQRVEAACMLALEHGIVRYAFVKSYLNKTRGAPEPQLSLLQEHPLIRKLSHYRELFSQLINEQENES
jgi:transposase